MRGTVNIFPRRCMSNKTTNKQNDTCLDLPPPLDAAVVVDIIK